MDNQTNKSSHIATETELRKDSHLELALSSANTFIDERFYYEPKLAAHPNTTEEWPVKIGTKTLRFPLWISSMTGGTQKTNEINLRLAKAAAKFGLGMGAGSSRIALESPEKANDFNLKPIIGDAIPYYLNFGIAQIEQMLAQGTINEIDSIVKKLNADGIFIHVNPFQEWMQPEGDIIQHAPIETIKQFLAISSTPVLVKEVGQGFGYESLKQLLQLPLIAIEFAANGGTNFSKLELARNKAKSQFYTPFVFVGHSAKEMVQMCNQLVDELGNNRKCESIIISGGIKDFLDGYYLLKMSKMNAVYGQASELLKHAQVSQESLEEYLQYQLEGLLLARTFLTIKKN
jgi:isopentenyl-diphosphate Delta-isomerase